MASKVYFWDLKTSLKARYDTKIKRLLKVTEVAKFIDSKDLVAIKLHFGEEGCTGFIRPIYIKPIVSFLKNCGAKVFLTDTNTLYVGKRIESVSHLLLAYEHGFDPSVLGAPIIIADGLKSHNEVVVKYDGNQYKEFYIARDILDADYMVNVSHFKGHELAGFGGAIKNIAMGCATRKGKMKQHFGLAPKVHKDKCIGCKRCIQVCEPKALYIDEDGKIGIYDKKCVGCGACFLECKQNALEINWDVDVKLFVERMVEYACATLSQFEKPVLHINFVINVTPYCDCKSYNDPPICPDIGVLASYDPVAIDQASLDLVNQAVCLSSLPQSVKPGDDKFKAIHKDTRGDYVLEYAENMGLGKRSYELIKI